VGDPARQLSHGLHLLRLAERLLGGFQLADLLLDDHGLDQLTRIIEDGRIELPDVTNTFIRFTNAELCAALLGIVEVVPVMGFVAIAIVGVDQFKIFFVRPVPGEIFFGRQIVKSCELL
jgi:hypothetical protein